MTNEKLQEKYDKARAEIKRLTAALSESRKTLRDLLAETKRVSARWHEAEAERDEARADAEWILEQLNDSQETIDNIRDGAKSWKRRR